MTAESVGQHLKQNVEGEQVHLSDDVLGGLVDLARVKKIYKLNSVPPKKGVVKDAKSDSAERKELEVSVLGVMSLKGS